ncbi:MAG: hypothetical protein ABW185_28820, partial [Sedimenticola sp.]
DESKFEEKQLPPKHEFYNDLQKEDISNEDFEHACRVFQELKISNLGEYSDLYLKTDVLLLTDVFENFREICLRDYNLDPAHFYSAPGLSFSAMLRMTNVELELLTDVDQLNMFERGVRGGFSQVSHRHAVANNYYMKDYDPTKPVSYISYLDANNLYGWAMMQKLPMRDFRFLDEREISQFNINDVDVEGEKGYLIECDLHYDISLHDSHQDLPLAPEKRKIGEDELSPFATHLWRQLNGEHCKMTNVEKLVTSLDDKDHYILHIRNLQLYVSLGLTIKKVHRVLEFYQEAWLKPYIDFNTAKRALAKTEFEKSFYKILNCSVFGKLLENQKKYKDIKLVSSEKRLNTLIAKPTYSSRKIFNESLVGVQFKRVKISITKPIYAGQAVLDISKCQMYDFWYNHLRAKYAEKIVLLMTDTDSLLFHVETNNIFTDMHENAHLYDTSDYSRNNFFHSDDNKKVPGIFKSETGTKIITRFTGLRSKMYAFTLDGEEKATKRAKGISRAVVDKVMRYKMFEDTLLENKEIRSEMDTIRSRSHELYVLKVCKKSLSCFDTKRFLLNSIESLPYGHYACDLYF